MKLWNPSRTILVWLLICALCYSGASFADPTGTPMSDFMGQFNNQSKALSEQLLLNANSLFWILALISLTWTMSMHLLRRSDISDVLAELVRFIVFTGLFFWFLQNASTDGGFVNDIVKSFSNMAVSAASSSGSGVTNLGQMGPTADGLMQIGLTIFDQIVDNTSIAGNSDLDNASMLILGFVVLVALAMTGIYVVIVTMSFWALAYAGIFLLGFGGSRWTSSVAINYYKHVFGVAVAYMAVILLLAIGVPFLQDYNAGLDPANKIKGLALMVVVSLLLLMLVAKIPKLLYSVVTTSRLGEAFEASGIFTQTLATARSAVWSSATQAYGDARSLLDANREAGNSATGRSNAYELFKPSSYESASTYSPDGLHGETLRPSQGAQGSAFGTSSVSRGESVMRAPAATSAGTVGAMTGVAQNAHAEDRQMPAKGAHETGRAGMPTGSDVPGFSQPNAGYVISRDQAQMSAPSSAGAGSQAGAQTLQPRVGSAGAPQAVELPPDLSALQSGTGQVIAGSPAQMSTLSSANAGAQLPGAAGAQTLQSRVGSAGTSQAGQLPPDLGALQSGAGQVSGGSPAQMSTLSPANAGAQLPGAAGAQTLQSRVGSAGASQASELPADLGALQSGAGQMVAGGQAQMATLASASTGPQPSATTGTQTPQPKPGNTGASQVGELSPDTGVRSGQVSSRDQMKMPGPSPESAGPASLGVAGAHASQSASAGVSQMNEPPVQRGNSAASGIATTALNAGAGSPDPTASKRVAGEEAQASSLSMTGLGTSGRTAQTAGRGGPAESASEGSGTSAGQALASQGSTTGASAAGAQGTGSGGNPSSAAAVAAADGSAAVINVTPAGSKVAVGTHARAASTQEAKGESGANSSAAETPVQAQADRSGKGRRTEPTTPEKRDGKKDMRPRATADRGGRAGPSKQQRKSKLDKDLGPLHKKTSDAADKDDEVAAFRDRRPASEGTAADPDEQAPT